MEHTMNWVERKGPYSWVMDVEIMDLLQVPEMGGVEHLPPAGESHGSLSRRLSSSLFSLRLNHVVVGLVIRQQLGPLGSVAGR